MYTYEDSAYDEYFQSLYEEELMKDGSIKEQIERIQDYLCQNGDAISERVDSLKSEALRLFDEGNFSSSLIHSVISLEILIRFNLIKPILTGLILSDSIVDLVQTRIITKSTYIDRSYLPKFLDHWRIDIENYKLKSGESFWEKAIHEVFKARNIFMHEGKFVTKELSAKAIECIEILSKIVNDFAINIGFTLEKSGRWNDISGGKDIFIKLEYNKYWDPKSPFKP